MTTWSYASVPMRSSIALAISSGSGGTSADRARYRVPSPRWPVRPRAVPAAAVARRRRLPRPPPALRRRSRGSQASADETVHAFRSVGRRTASASDVHRQRTESPMNLACGDAVQDGHRAELTLVQCFRETTQDRLIGIGGDTVDDQLVAGDAKGQRGTALRGDAPPVRPAARPPARATDARSDRSRACAARPRIRRGTRLIRGIARSPRCWMRRRPPLSISDLRPEIFGCCAALHTTTFRCAQRRAGAALTVNAKTVFERYVSPGLRTVVGNSGWFGESG